MNDIYSKISELRQRAYDADLAASVEDCRITGFEPMQPHKFDSFGPEDWTFDPTYGLTLGDPETDYCVTIGEDDSVTVFAAGSISAQETITGAYSLLADARDAVLEELNQDEDDDLSTWSPIELRAAREALGLTVNGMAAALVSPYTSRPWKGSRVTECESGVRPIQPWVRNQVKALEVARDELTDRMITAMEADPDGLLIVHSTDTGLWAVHPDMQHQRISAAIHRTAAALAAAQIEAETGRRARLVDLDTLPKTARKIIKN